MFRNPAVNEPAVLIRFHRAGHQDKISSEAEFGKDFLSKHFLLDPEWTFVNHGAFGAPLREAYELSERWRRHAELQPLRFIDRTLFPHIVQVAKSNISPCDLALISLLLRANR
jgi:hypothetical protein